MAKGVGSDEKLKHEFSAGAAIFRLSPEGMPLYLVLHYHFKRDYWDFPRGNIEEGERPIETAKREIWEETGLSEDDLVFMPGFEEAAQWFYVAEGIRIFKRAIYFLAQALKDEVKLSEEHLEYQWLPFEEAHQRLTYENNRRVLRKANEYLKAKMHSE